MSRYLATLTLLSILFGAPATAAADSAEAVIGGQPAVVELPDGYCAMSEIEPSDARLIGFLRNANAGTNTVRLVFAECLQLQRWRRGEQETLDDYGYLSTPDQYENTPVNMPLPDFVALMSKSLNGAGMKDFERGIEMGEDRVRKHMPDIEVNGSQNLGVIFEDDRAVYVGIVQKLRTEGGSEKVVLGSVMNTMLKNRVTHMYLYTEFGDDALATLLGNSRTLVDRTVAANEG